MIIINPHKLHLDSMLPVYNRVVIWKAGSIDESIDLVVSFHTLGAAAFSRLIVVGGEKTIHYHKKGHMFVAYIQIYFVANCQVAKYVL